MLRDWASVPTAADISKRLANDADYVRFRSVCFSWRSAAPKRPQIPWLLLDVKDETGNGALGLYNYPNITDLQLIFNPRPPQGTSRWDSICGSSRGWIALLDDAPGISLYKPFTEAHVRLPPLTDLPDFSNGCQVKKSPQGFAFYRRDGTRDGPINPFHSYGRFLANHVVLSSDPSDDNCVVMAISYNGERLIYCRPGDATWTPLSPAFHIDFYQDIIFYKGSFFAVSYYRLFVCDIGSDALMREILPADPSFIHCLNDRAGLLKRYRVLANGLLKSYLVVSNGDLLLATITDYFPSDKEHSFVVYRVELDGGKLGLSKLESLGGHSLFLGKVSMSISAPSCKGNCIYFSEMTSVTGSDPDTSSPTIKMFDHVGVHNMEDGTTSFIPSLPNNAWGAHWLTPNLGY